MGQPKSETERAADLIGQAQVLASPMAMATVARVGPGRSASWYRDSRPIEDKVPEPKGTPMTQARGRCHCAGLMRGVVTSGPAAFGWRTCTVRT